MLSLPGSDAKPIMRGVPWMQVDLSGRAAIVLGEPGAVADAVRLGLADHGARLVEDAAGADLLVFCHALRGGGSRERAGAIDAAMAEQGRRLRHYEGARLISLLPALALVAARRHGDQSCTAAASAAAVRTLAMALAPGVLVNAVAVGPVGTETELVAGDPAMLSHTALRRPARIEDVVAAVMFFCDPANSYSTGQVLAVDAGWSAGFARDF